MMANIDVAASHCEACAHQFAEAGGCDTLVSGGNAAAYIPSGCGDCAEAAQLHCRSGMAPAVCTTSNPVRQCPPSHAHRAHC